MPRSLVAIVVLTIGLAIACTGAQTVNDPAAALEERLLSPCCWRQSLRDHESPTAIELRAEIADRVARGERPQSIEADFVRRFGDEIRALPQGSDPRWQIGVATVLACVGGLAGLIGLVRRRRPRGFAPSSDPDPDSHYNDVLDDELAHYD